MVLTIYIYKQNVRLHIKPLEWYVFPDRELKTDGQRYDIKVSKEDAVNIGGLPEDEWLTEDFKRKEYAYFSLKLLCFHLQIMGMRLTKMGRK